MTSPSQALYGHDSYLLDGHLSSTCSMNGSHDDPISSLPDDGHHLVIPAHAELDLSRLIRGRLGVPITLSGLLNDGGLLCLSGLLNGHPLNGNSGLGLKRSLIHDGLDVHKVAGSREAERCGWGNQARVVERSTARVPENPVGKKLVVALDI